MPNVPKETALAQLREAFGTVRPLPRSRSLFEIGSESARIYFRYSKVHPRGNAFYGLREVDLRQLEGHNSFICLLNDRDDEPLYIPFSDLEEVFHTASTASDGQFKVQLFTAGDVKELYVTRVGRFNVDADVGIAAIERSLDGTFFPDAMNLSHGAIQALLAEIGAIKGYDVFVPRHDILSIGRNLTTKLRLRDALPNGYDDASAILAEIDVVWMEAGRDSISGLFEVEHSTPVYSGLLRFNDVFLTNSALSRFVVVSNDARRELFIRQSRRPTFVRSGLSELASFLDYANVVAWHLRLQRDKQNG